MLLSDLVAAQQKAMGCLKGNGRARKNTHKHTGYPGEGIMSNSRSLERLRHLAAYYKDVLAAQIQSAGRHYLDLGAVVGRGLVADPSPFLSRFDEITSQSELRLQIEPASPVTLEKVLDAAERAESSEDERSDDETETVLTRRQMSARLTAIYRKQQQDPFNRETILGLPIVAGRYGPKLFCGPLFYFRVQVEHDPFKNEIRIARLNEEPLLNMSLLSSLVGDEAEGDLVRQKLLPLVMEETFDETVIGKAARVVSELVRGLRGLRRQGSDLVSLAECLLARGGDAPVYFNGCVVVNAPRSHAFLQDDLSALSKLDFPANGTATDLFLEETEDPIPDLDDPMRTQDGGLLYFPLMSNPAQRKAAAKVERARLLTIQGPPGTGKSQTIANLVCHLVALGHSVLVTSHQNKALEVVTDKLPQIDYLAMSLLKADRESVEMLRTQLDQYESVTAGLGLADLEAAFRRSIERLDDLKRHICAYHARFAELKQLERTQESPYRRYAELRDYDGIHPADTPGEDLAAAEVTLKQWQAHLLGVLPAFAHLYRFYVVDGGTSSADKALSLKPLLQKLLGLAEEALACMQGPSTNRDQINAYVELTKMLIHETGENRVSAASLVAQTLASACAVMKGFQEALNSPLWSDWGPLADKADSGTGQDLESVQEVIDWLEASAPELERLLEVLRGDFSLGVGRRISREVDRGSVSGLVAELNSLMEQLNLCPEPTGITIPTDPKTVVQVSQIVQVLKRARRNWFRWHLFPSCRRAGKALSALGYPILSFGSAEETLSALQAWESHWRSRHRAVTLCQHWEQLGVPAESPGPADPVGILRTVAQTNAAMARVILLAGELPQWKGSRTMKEVVEARLDGLRTAAQVAEVLAGLKLLRSVVQSRTEVQRWAASSAQTLVTGQLAPIYKALCDLKLTPEAQEAWDWARRLVTGGSNPLPAPVASYIECQHELHNLLAEHPWSSGHREYWLGPVARIIEGTVDPGVSSALDELRVVAEHTPEFAGYLTFAAERLKGLDETRRHVEASAQQGQLPTWLAEPGKALDAHRLRRLLVDDLCSCPDDLNAVAGAASKAQEEYRHEVRRVLEHSRRLAIKNAQNDPKTHRTISKVRTLLGRKRKTPSLLRLREQIDYRLLLKVFPCWLMNVEDVARVFPLVAGLFDYVIVDEASQCQQAIALHLAYRAQRLLVVGDPQQLQSPSTRFLSANTVQLLLARHDLEEQAFKFDARRSFLDLAEYCAQGREFLNEHFRCEPAIIAWSNERFYRGRLTVVTPVRSPRFNPCLEWRLLRGVDDDPEQKVNDAEARAVVGEVRRLVESGEANGLSIGVMSPFREQANRMHSLIFEILADHSDWIRRHEIVSATADGFQGDERDIVLYSFRYGPSTPPGTIKAIELERERLNVAFTRARRRAICFTSVTLDRLPEGLIRSFLEHVVTSQRNGTDSFISEDRFDSEFERRVCQRLRSLGYSVTTQVPCGPFRIDLVVRDGEGRRLAVECDGDFHYDEEGYLRPEDYQRQDLLERAGWTVHRVSCRRFYWDPDSAMADLLEVFRQQETESERALVQQSLGEEEAELSQRPKIGSLQETEHRVPQAKAVTDLTTAAPGTALPVASARPGPQPARPVLDSPELLRPENWFYLSHWSKSTGLFSPYNNRFCYGFGTLLARRQAPTERQAHHAKKLWELAVRRGFCPEVPKVLAGAREHLTDHPPESVSETPLVSLPISHDGEVGIGQVDASRGLRVLVCDLGKIHTRIGCPALVNQDSVPTEMSLREALMAGHAWCSWCLRHRSVGKAG